MKKFFAVLLTLILGIMTLTVLVGCGDKVTVNVRVPGQTPSLAILKLLNDNEQINSSKYNVNYELVDGTAISGVMSTGNPDIVIAPTNIIASLFNADEPVKYQIVAATSFGAFHLLITDPAVTSFEDLAGKSIVCQGAPNGAGTLVLKSLLNARSITATVTNNTNTENLTTDMRTGAVKIALYPEPAFTATKDALIAAGKTPSQIDLQEIWEDETGDAGYPMACLAIKKDFLAEHKSFCDSFVTKVKASTEWVTNPANKATVSAALPTINTTWPTGITSDIYEKSISRSHIGFELTDKTKIVSYLGIIAPALAVNTATFNDMFYTGITIG